MDDIKLLGQASNKLLPQLSTLPERFTQLAQTLGIAAFAPSVGDFNEPPLSSKERKVPTTLRLVSPLCLSVQ